MTTTSELNDAAIKLAKARAIDGRCVVEIGDAECKGLRFPASHGGACTFSLLYTPRGERKINRILVGKYPGTGIAEARRRARALKGEVADGGDPVERKRAAKADLLQLTSDMPFTVEAIQVDGGSEFMAEFEAECQARRTNRPVLQVDLESKPFDIRRISLKRDPVRRAKPF